MLLANDSREAKGVVEVAPDVEDACAVGHGLSELALGDIAAGDDDVSIEAAVRRVGCG